MFPSQPRSVVVSHQLPHPSSAHRPEFPGLLLNARNGLYLQLLTPFPSPSAKATTLPHNRQQQSPFRAMLSSSDYFCTMHPPAIPLWQQGVDTSHQLCTQAAQNWRHLLTRSLLWVSLVTCLFLCSVAYHLTPPRNKKFPTLQTKDQYMTNYQNISEVYDVCEQENENKNTESFFLGQTSCKGLSSFTNSTVYERGHLQTKRNRVAGKAMVRHIKHGSY